MQDGEARTLAARLLSAFPGRDVPVGTAALYVEYLSRYPLEVGQNVVKRLIESEEWAPPLSILHDALSEENGWYEAVQRTGLSAGEVKEMTPEERHAAGAPIREYLRKRRVGAVPDDMTDEAREQEIAEKRERARSLSE